MKLLLIEVQPGKIPNLIRILRESHYPLDLAADSGEAALMARSGVYDLIIYASPGCGQESMSLLKGIRGQGIHTPLLVITEGVETQKLVEFLDNGADDYLIMPCEQELFLAHIRALGRRAADMWENDVLEYGLMRCVPSRCEVLGRGQVTRLTLKEMQILECLIRNRNCVLTRDQLSHRIWGYNGGQDNNNLEVHISYLRKKLKRADSGVQIQTIRGVGYCLKEEKALLVGNAL